jgi:hypothetical protein
MTISNRRAIICAVLIAVALAVAVARPRAAQPAGTTALLDDYAAGRFEVVDRALTSTASLRDLGNDLRRQAPEWIGTGGTTTRRRLVVASVALEAAGAKLGEWGEGRWLVEWGCERLRTDPPREAERIWHLAAIALAEGAYDVPFLTEHLEHAAQRFPDEDRVALARAVAFETGTWPLPGAPWTGESHTGSLALKELAGMFEALVPRRSIAAEAHLRLGHTELRLGRAKRGLDSFARIESLTHEPFLVYLSRYFAGRAHHATGDAAKAAAAYRGALAVVPRAQSASFALAALSFVAGDREDAYTTIARGLEPGLPVDDPWRLYQAADARFWRSFIELLRSAVR